MTLSKEETDALTAAQEARTKAKASVTRKVTRIANAVGDRYSTESMEKLLVNLETEYTNFLDKHDTYDTLCTELDAPSSFLVVNQLDMKTYEAAVKAKFIEGKEMYINYVSQVSQGTHSCTDPCK